MGVSGAALATLIAEIASSSSFLILLFKKRLATLSKLISTPSFAQLTPLLKAGAALQIRNLASNALFLVVARKVHSIDNTGIAASAHSLAIQVFQLGGIVLLALSTVAQTMVPNEMVARVIESQNDYDTTTVQNITVGGPHAAKILVHRLMSWGVILGIFLGSLQILLLPLLHNMTPLPEVQTAARLPSYIACFTQVINGLVFVGEGVMIGCNDFLQLSVFTAIATAFALGALEVFPKKMGLSGVWMSFIVWNIWRLVGVCIHQFYSGPLASRNIHTNGMKNVR